MLKIQIGSNSSRVSLILFVALRYYEEKNFRRFQRLGIGFCSWDLRIQSLIFVNINGNSLDVSGPN